MISSVNLSISTATFDLSPAITPPAPKEPDMSKIGKPRPYMSAAEALASDAELGPAYSGPMTRSDNHVSKIHTEIKVNDKIIARVYNSGAVEIADEYRFLSDELRPELDTMVGPDLAVDRANRIKASLERHGAVMKDELSPTALLTAKLTQTPVLELLKAGTAQTQDEWLAFKAKEGPADPGALFSHRV
jgi:hypothetical protein